MQFNTLQAIIENSLEIGKNITLSSAHHDKLLIFTGTETQTVTIPVGLQSGFSCTLLKTTGTAVRVVLATGVTIANDASSFLLPSNSAVRLSSYQGNVFNVQRDVAISNGYALKFTKSHFAHVNHQRMFPPSTLFTSFFYEFLIKPDGSDGYFFSAGNGGTHCLLFGTNSAVDGMCTLTGNVFFDGTGTSFTSWDSVRVGEWAHVAVAGEASTGKITLIINGVPCGLVNSWGGQRRTASEADANAFIGGSDHQNWGGKIACIRGFEGVVPYTNVHNNVARPPISEMTVSNVYNGSASATATFIAPYFQGHTNDISDGISGVKHNGFLSETLSNGNTGSSGYSYSFTANRDATKVPQFETDPFIYSSQTVLKPPIANATSFHGFGLYNVHYGNSSALSIGTKTEVGGYAWQGSTANFGILNGNAFPYNTAPGIIWFDDARLNCTIRLDKAFSSSAFFPTGLSSVYKIIFNVVNATNYNVFYADEFGQGFVIEVVAGTPTTIGGAIAFGTTWNYMKVNINGATITVFNGETSKGTRTVSNNLTGTGKGFELTSPFCRVSQIAVI